MSFLDSIQQKIGFTRREAIAILTLAATFLAGLSIRRLSSDHEAGAMPTRQFDYSKSDSAYRARSLMRADSVSIKQSMVGKETETRAASQSTREKLKGFTGVVNINTASKAQLMKLPGIGPSYAERILQYRTAHGKFASINELSNIKGIGEKTMEKLRPFITVQ